MEGLWAAKTANKSLNTLFVGFFASYVKCKEVGGGVEQRFSSINFEAAIGNRREGADGLSNTNTTQGLELLNNESNKRNMIDFMMRNYLEALHRYNFTQVSLY